MKVKSESEVAQSCPTLSNPMDCSLPGSSVHGIFQARVLEWGAIAFSEKTVYSTSKTIAFLMFLKFFCFTFQIIIFIHIYAYNIGEGNGTPFQYSCLENPMDGGAC